ncbi:MAG: SDR family oxidoreductase [Muribaculaceae bacterium]|nr:SDR family oxidoreductase [Muribaculaceae bacterium]
MGIISNPFSLEGKTILVTGASSGIGRSTAIEASNLGARIILVARDENRLKETQAALSGQGHRIIAADLTDEMALNNLVEECGALDGVVLCAGKGLTRPVQFCDRSRFDEIFNINFFSTAELLRLLYKKKRLVKGASAVLITSMGGTHVFSGGNSIYGSSKAALDSFMKFAAKEFAARNIRVNSVCPSMIETPLIHSGAITEEQLAEYAKRFPLKRFGRPEDVAYAAVYLLSPASAWVTGTSMIVDGGFSIS